jgi:hypothetical protein
MSAKILDFNSDVLVEMDSLKCCEFCTFARKGSSYRSCDYYKNVFSPHVIPIPKDFALMFIANICVHYNRNYDYVSVMEPMHTRALRALKDKERLELKNEILKDFKKIVTKLKKTVHYSDGFCAGLDWSLDTLKKLF